jgi:hypothetical protein
MTSLFVLLLLLLVLTEKSSQTHEAKENEESDDDGNTCTLYMAPSSVNSIDAFGIFTVKPFKKGSLLLPTDCPGIPMIDPASHFTAHDNDFLHCYSWFSGHSADADNEASEVGEFAVTFHALPNHHGYLAALDPVTARPSYDDTLVDRSKDPEAGAFSYHLGRDFYALRDLKPGDEIFLDYGVAESPNLAKQERYSWVKYTPEAKDYDLAGHLLKLSWDLVEFIRSSRNIAGLSRPVNKTLQDQLTKYSIEHLLDALALKAASINRPRVDYALPSSLDELNRIAERVAHNTPFAEALALEVGITHRSVDWIIENGRCVDNIIPGKSKIPRAGQGAFAQRLIRAGDVIVPLPLFQMHKDSFTIWSDDEGKYTPNGTQLLLNYCFSHSNSSLVLCPLTNAALINHCSTRNAQCGEQGPNAIYRWDTTWDLFTNKWLNMSVEEIHKQLGKGLAFEIVATRDIEPGDEVCLARLPVTGGEYSCYSGLFVVARMPIDFHRLRRGLGKRMGRARGELGAIAGCCRRAHIVRYQVE